MCVCVRVCVCATFRDVGKAFYPDNECETTGASSFSRLKHNTFSLLYDPTLTPVIDHRQQRIKIALLTCFFSTTRPFILLEYHLSHQQPRGHYKNPPCPTTPMTMPIRRPALSANQRTLQLEIKPGSTLVQCPCQISIASNENGSYIKRVLTIHT